MTKREAAGGMGARARQAAGAADGLVGRGDVLARLGRAVDDAVAGHGGLVLLTGEAGIGKTTVAARAAAAGLGGRARRLGDQSERARKTVTARIRHLIDRVDRVHPALGAHLRASVTTGTFCTYSPPSPTAWEL
jgi:hypothetical protein